MNAYSEVDRLARYLLERWPQEIGTGDPVRGKSAVDVAIRLLERLRAGLATRPEGGPEPK